MDFVAIDFETANEKNISACEIGIAVVKNYRIIESHNYLIRPPENRFNRFNTWLHGIDAVKVEGEPGFDEVWKKIKRHFRDELVIAHNAGFDLPVLRDLLNYYEIDFPKLNYTCSIKVARKVWTDRSHYGLKSLTKWLGIELKHHRAVSDARACAQIASMAFRENQVSIFEEIESKLDIIPGYIEPGKFFATRNKTVKKKKRRKLPSDKKKKVDA